MDTNLIIIIACSVVILSYLFSVISSMLRIPSVLLLLATGIGLKHLTNYIGVTVDVPNSIIELLGTVGLIMIVLEAGLDLKLSREKIGLIRNSFISALVIQLLSAALIAGFLFLWLKDPFLNCFVYAIPLSIISSAVVIPSIGHLAADKKEFLVYESSFSDVIGILVFNYFTAREIFTWLSLGVFVGNLLLSIVVSIALSLLLFYLLLRTQLHIRFFLLFALLVLLETLGKILHLPSLLIILVFGLLINNWSLLYGRIKALFPAEEIEGTVHLLQNITAESSFLIRTFFFLLFGYSFNISDLFDPEVVFCGSIIVGLLIIIRYLYLRLFISSNIFPEVFYIPRGLITILLFYKIPAELQLPGFNEGILFFIILSTGFIMMLGMIFDRDKETPAAALDY